jgi:hypothetical protein
LDSTALEHPTTKLLLTLQYSTSNSSADFKDRDFTDFQECLFAETHFVSQEKLVRTVINSFRIRDDESSDPHGLRNIVVIGRSVKQELRVLLRLRIDFYKAAPIVAILDTHRMFWELLGPKSSPSKVDAPKTGFTLGMSYKNSSANLRFMNFMALEMMLHTPCMRC